jgi:hypothetical protein
LHAAATCFITGSAFYGIAAIAELFGCDQTALTYKSWGDSLFRVGFFFTGASILLEFMAAAFTAVAICSAQGTSEELVGGSVRVSERSLAGLRDARNLQPAPLQATDPSTGQSSPACGLYTGASVIKNVNPGGQINFSGVRSDIAANGYKGLDTIQLGTFIRNNVPDDVAVLTEHAVEEDQLIQMVGQGDVIALVDEDHWVRVLRTFEENGVEWAQIYDPGRGIYEQLLTSFMTRCGPNNQMVAVRPPG